VPEKSPIEIYCDEQIAAADTTEERIAALKLKAALAAQIRSHSKVGA